ncbi:MAG: PQQ-dependent sugar dehydrogenase, partial [Nitrospiraceae bacterium]
MVGLVVLITGCLAGCSGNDTQQNSQLPTSTSLTLQTVTTDLTFPVFMTADPSDNTRLFIVEKGGVIKIFDRNSSSLRPTAFLDLSILISTVGERGLLGMAFDPGYSTNGQFYVFYTDVNGNLVIARYQRVNADLANPASAVVLLTVKRDRNLSNHNGGMLAFG